MTPFEIEMIQHFNVSAADYPMKHAPIYPATLQSFKAEGLVWEDGERIMTTERGRKYCEMLCAVPLPAIVDPREIVSDKPAFLRKIMD